MPNNRVEIDIQANNNFGAAFSKLGSSVIVANQALQLMSSAFDSIASSMDKVLEAGDKFKRLEIRLGALGKSTGEVAGIMDRLTQFSLQVPVSLDVMSRAFLKLEAGGVKQTERSLKALVNAVAAFGGSSQQLDRAAVAMQQMGGKGKVSMEELRQQLGEQIPTAIKIMARELGLTTAELDKLVSKGLVDAQTGIMALTRGFEKDFPDAALAMRETWEGSITMLKNQWEQLLRAIAEGGLLDAAISSAQALTKSLSGVVTNVRQLLGIMKTAKDASDFIDTDKAEKLRGFRWVDLFTGVNTLNLDKAASEMDLLTEALILNDQALITNMAHLKEETAIRDAEKAKIAQVKLALEEGTLALEGWSDLAAKVNAGPLTELISGWQDLESGMGEMGRHYDRFDEWGESVETTLQPFRSMVELEMQLTKTLQDRAARNNEFGTPRGGFTQIGGSGFRHDLRSRQGMDQIPPSFLQNIGGGLGDFGAGAGTALGGLGGIAGFSGAMSGFQAGGPLGAAGGFLMELLLKNPKMQEAMQKISEVLVELLDPIADVLAPMLEAFVPVIRALKPVFEVIGFVLGKHMAPLIKVTEAGGRAIRSLTKAAMTVARAMTWVRDALVNLFGMIEKLIKTIASWNPLTPGNSRSFLSTVTLGFLHEGREQVTSQDLMRLPGMAQNEGVAILKEGEQVVTGDEARGGSRTSGAPSIVFNIQAISPRESAEEIRLLIEELVLTRQLGLA